VRCWEPIPEPQRLILLNFSILNILISLTLISALPKPVLSYTLKGIRVRLDLVAEMVTRLSVRLIAKLPPGRHADGNGLYIHVRESGLNFCFRWMRHGRRHEIGLGPYPFVSLDVAREKAFQLRRDLAMGKQVRAPGSATFIRVAQAFIKAQAPGWRNRKHLSQWSRTLEHYVFPHIGQMPVDRIETSHVLAILGPIWSTKSETAARVRGRIESILDAAKVRGLRTGDNPARWNGHLDKILPRRSKTAPVRHHAALDFIQTKALFQRLAATNGVRGREAARALRFLILTAARTGEVLGATWQEIDPSTGSGQAIWTISASRMKAGKPHRVPLTDAALAIIGFTGSGYLFGNGNGPLSHMAMSACLRRLGCKATVHGFRSTFRDWAAAETSAPREVAEACLAHAVGNKTEAAYFRSDLFAKRRKLMELWATVLTI
jgi:integrase